MRSAGVAGFTPVTVTVFSTRVFRVVTIAHLRRTVGAATLAARPGIKSLGSHRQQLGVKRVRVTIPERGPVASRPQTSDCITVRTARQTDSRRCSGPAPGRE